MCCCAALQQRRAFVPVRYHASGLDSGLLERQDIAVQAVAEEFMRLRYRFARSPAKCLLRGKRQRDASRCRAFHAAMARPECQPGKPVKRGKP